MKIPTFLRGFIRSKGGVTRKPPERTPPPSKCQKQGVGRQITQLQAILDRHEGWYQSYTGTLTFIQYIEECLNDLVAETPEPGGYTKHDKVAMEADLNREYYKPDPRDPMLCDEHNINSNNETPSSPVVAETRESGGSSSKVQALLAVAESLKPGESCILGGTQYSSKPGVVLTIFISCNETPVPPSFPEWLKIKTGRVSTKHNPAWVQNLIDNPGCGLDEHGVAETPAGGESAGEGGYSGEKVDLGEKSGAGAKIFLVLVSRARSATDRSPGKIGVDIPAVLVGNEGEPYESFVIPPLSAEELNKIFSKFRDAFKGPILAEPDELHSDQYQKPCPSCHFWTVLTGWAHCLECGKPLDKGKEIADNDWEPSVDLALYNLEHLDDEYRQCPYCSCWTYTMSFDRCSNCGKDVTTYE